MPPPAATLGDDVGDDIEVHSLPSRLDHLGKAAASAGMRAKEAAARVYSAARAPERPPWFLPAIGAAGIVGLIVVVSAIRALLSPSPPQTQTAAAETKPSSQAVPKSTSTEPAPATPAPPPPSVKACVLAGAPKVVAAAATLEAGVEARVSGEGVVLGFAPNDHEATAIRLDPSSLAVTGTSSVHSTEVVRRVHPVVNSKESPGIVVDVDRKHDGIEGRRTLPIDPPIQVGVSGNDLVWARGGGPIGGKLWTLQSEGEVEALRGVSEGAPDDSTTVVVFRQGNGIWIGAAAGYRKLAPKGELWHVDGLGAGVGSPSAVLSDGQALVAWADRATSDAPWHLRLTRWKPGDAPGEAQAFVQPPGGAGDNVMSPGIAAVPGGGYFLVWTEGPTARHRVRAVTLSADGRPLGAALEVSSEATNAGQGQAALVNGGKGVIAYLEAGDGAFQVVARPISCADSS